MGLVVATLGRILLPVLLCGGGYWLSQQDWSIDDAAETRGAGETAGSMRSASVHDLTWSVDRQVFLSRIAGGPNGGNPLLLHRFDEESSVHSISTQPVSFGEQRVLNAVLLPDASAVIVIDESAMASKIEIESGARTQLWDLSTSCPIRPSMAVAFNGSCLAVALEGGVQLFDPVSGQEGLRLPGCSSSVTGIAFSDDNDWIAAGHADGTIRTWKRSTGEVVHDLARHEGPVTGVRFVNGSRRLATVAVEWDDTLRLWDLESGSLLWKSSAGQLGLYALAVSTDRRLAATGGADREIVLWNLNERLRLRSCSGHTGMVRALHFSPDGKALTSASSDGTICVWDVDSADLLSSIDVSEIVGSSRDR